MTKLGDAKTDYQTVSQHDYHSSEGGDRYAITRHADAELFDMKAGFDGHTIYSDAFKKGATGQRVTGVRPSTALKLGGSRELVSGYQAVSILALLYHL